MTENGEEKPTFGSRLKEKRLEKGWSQHQLAALASCTNSNISYLESHPNQHPKIETVESLAGALGWDINEARRLAGYPERDDNLTRPEVEKDFGASLEGYRQLSDHGRELVKKQIGTFIDFVSECEKRTSGPSFEEQTSVTPPDEPARRIPGRKKKGKQK